MLSAGRRHRRQLINKEETENSCDRSAAFLGDTQTMQARLPRVNLQRSRRGKLE